MARFIPKGKLSKKAQKELNRQRRVTWEFSPVTKTVESKKRYNRKKNSCDRHEDYGIGVFQFQSIQSFHRSVSRKAADMFRSLSAGHISSPEFSIDFAEFLPPVNIVLIHLNDPGTAAVTEAGDITNGFRYDLFPFFPGRIRNPNASSH